MIVELKDNRLIADEINDYPYSVGYFIHNNTFYKGQELVSFISGLITKNSFWKEVPKFSGCFQIVLIDQRQKEVTVIQDRWGTYPLFYRHEGNKMLISDNYRRLINQHSSYQKEALAEMLSFGHVIGDKTLLSNIREFKPHCITRISLQDDGEIRIKEESYWRYELEPESVSFKSASRDFAELWQSKMQIICNAFKGEKAYVPLSAGLDSRLIAAALDKNEIPQYNLTFGAGIENLEINTAKEVSQYLNGSLGHQILHIDQDGYRQLIHEANHTYRITTAYFSEKDLWYPSKNKEQISCFLPGHSGDFMAGSHLKTKMKIWKSKEDIAQYLIDFKSSPLGRHLFQTDKELKDLLWQSVMDSIEDGDPINSFIRWDLEERQRRYIIRSVVAENHAELPLLVLPYFDYDLMDFFSKLPFSFLHNTLLYRDAIGRHILKDQDAIRNINVNGQPLNPILTGMAREYYLKIKTVIRLGQKNSAVFDHSINWDEFLGTSVFPSQIPTNWIDKGFYKSNARFYYALQAFHKDFMQINVR